MSHIELRNAQHARLSPFGFLRAAIRLAAHHLVVSRSRKALANLDSHQLQDIGIFYLLLDENMD